MKSSNLIKGVIFGFIIQVFWSIFWYLLISLINGIIFNPVNWTSISTITYGFLISTGIICSIALSNIYIIRLDNETKSENEEKLLKS